MNFHPSHSSKWLEENEANPDTVKRTNASIEPNPVRGDSGSVAAQGGETSGGRRGLALSAELSPSRDWQHRVLVGQAAHPICCPHAPPSTTRAFPGTWKAQGIFPGAWNLDLALGISQWSKIRKYTSWWLQCPFYAGDNPGVSMQSLPSLSSGSSPWRPLLTHLCLPQSLISEQYRPIPAVVPGPQNHWTLHAVSPKWMQLCLVWCKPTSAKSQGQASTPWENNPVCPPPCCPHTSP